MGGRGAFDSLVTPGPCFESTLHTRARDNSPSLHPPAPSLQIPPPSPRPPAPDPDGSPTPPSQDPSAPAHGRGGRVPAERSQSIPCWGAPVPETQQTMAGVSRFGNCGRARAEDASSSPRAKHLRLFLLLSPPSTLPVLPPSLPATRPVDAQSVDPLRHARRRPPSDLLPHDESHKARATIPKSTPCSLPP